MGFVQIGELVDSIAEFVLNVADAILDRLSVLVLRLSLFEFWMFCIQECGIAWFNVSDLHCDIRGFLTDPRCARGDSHDCCGY